MSPGTLSRQLRTRVTLIVAVLAVLLAAGTIISARQIIYGQIDSQLDTAIVLQRRGRPGTQNHVPGITVPGMPPGTVVLVQDSVGNSVSNQIGAGEFKSLSSEAEAALLQVPLDDQKHTLSIPEMGEYRAEARQGDGIQVVVALPLDDLNQTVLWLTILAAGLGLISVAVAAMATRAATDSATRGLRELSKTASEVSLLPLHTGQVSVPAPVPVGNLPPSHEVAQLTTAFNHMLGNVEGALAARHASEQKLLRFVADASHELRNPLAAISGYSELASRSTQPADPDTSFALGRICSESARMTKLVNDLLLLARLDAEVAVELKPVDVVETVLNAVSDARVTGPEHNWRLQLPAEGIEVRANADQLHQAVVNLLANARIHTPAGTTVTTSVAIKDAQACLQVRDDGPGIPAEVLSQVFERFSRADPARAHNSKASTGLGLAIVKAVVETSGGRTEVTSQPGNTCFTIWLPLATSQ